MRFRIQFLLVTSFFITMNVLLWRAEYGTRGSSGTPVPPELIWEKILTSPDISQLEIRHRGAKIGRAHCVATIGEALATGRIMEDLPPEGMVKTLTGYTLDFDGNLALDEFTRVRFNSHFEFDTNQAWQRFSIKLTLKPFVWELHADAATHSLRFASNDGEKTEERTFSSADLRQPEKLARDLGGIALPAALRAFGVPLPTTNVTAQSVGLQWEATSDRVKIGSNLVRAYRLEARLFDRYKAVLFVSPVGELLRVELPDGIVLFNEALLNL